LNERIHWVVCAIVKRWAIQNDMKNPSMFTSFALTWLVLFYLMAAEVVPPLKLLREHADYSKNTLGSDFMFIEGTWIFYKNKYTCSIQITTKLN